VILWIQHNNLYLYFIQPNDITIDALQPSISRGSRNYVDDNELSEKLPFVSWICCGGSCSKRVDDLLTSLCDFLGFECYTSST
jgi:hypothetical protein